jgi:glycosyltransferase involved in cell wall biosynthesis
VRLCINSQSPPLRFKLSLEELREKYGLLPDPIDLREFQEGVDYEFTPGGVTAMVYPLVSRMLREGYLEKANWVSLGVKYPPRVRMGDIMATHIEVPDDVLRDYSVFKEGLWSQIHGMGGELAFDRGYEAYSKYNWVNSQKLLELRDETDVFYIQDFQLLLTGGVIGPPAPAILRWHVPFVPSVLPSLTHRGIVKWIETFDAIVVSCRRDLEGLISSGYKGRAHQVFPFVDPAEWRGTPSASSLDHFRGSIGLRRDESLLLVVARMDRIKSQDVAIRALARLKDRNNFRLALVGNGSFSSSKSGGLGHGKASQWRAELEELASQLGVRDRVSFTGYASPEELRAAYSLASVVLLPSNLEGFGISVLEGWMNKKPVVVSRGAGVSELVVDGSNGYIFPPQDDVKAAEAVLKAAPAGEKLGEFGYETAKQCYIGVALEREKAVLDSALSIYK